MVGVRLPGAGLWQKGQPPCGLAQRCPPAELGTANTGVREPLINGECIATIGAGLMLRAALVVGSTIDTPGVAVPLAAGGATMALGVPGAFTTTGMDADAKRVGTGGVGGGVLSTVVAGCIGAAKVSAPWCEP